jgi:hypothetical protein
MTENTENNQNLVQIKSLDAEIKALREKRELLANAIKKEEPVNITKLRTGMLSLANPVLWLKDLAGLLNIRKLIIYALIIGGIYGYGYIKGVKGKPVHFDMRGKEATIKLNEHFLHILPDGTAQVEDKDGKVLKKIAVKDIPELKKALMPIGFQLKPFVLGGYGITQGTSGFEGGVGISWFKLWRANLDSFLTNRAIYPIGVSYKLDQIKMPNSAIGLGGGIGYDNSIRTILYFKVNF